MAAAPGARELTFDRGAEYPAISPDGKTIAFGILGRIAVVPSSGGTAQPLTDGAGWDSRPAWSPDGRFLAYSHASASGAELRMYDLSSGTTSSLYSTNFGVGQIAFNPAGGNIYFILDRNQLDAHLWQVPTAGGTPKQITFAESWHEWSFAPSPDGKRVIIDSGHFGGSNLYEAETGSAKARRLTDTPAHESSVNWPGAATVFYIETSNGIETIVARDLESGKARSLYSSPYDQKQLAVSRDGRWGVLCAGRKLYRIDLETGSPAPIPFQVALTLPPRRPADLVITNAKLFDGVSGDVKPDSTIEVRDGRIQSIHSGPPTSGGTLVFDAAGKFVMPGLIDNHYHYWSPFAGAELLRRGITSIRDPGVGISTSMNFKQANDAGLQPGPKIYSCGPLLDGPGTYHPMVTVELSSAAAAAPVIHSLKEQGADCIKVYFLLAPDVLAAAVKAAHENGLPVTGHIGVRTGWRDAMTAGIDGLTHIRLWRDLLPLELQPQGENENLDGAKYPLARMQADWTRIDPEGEGAGEIIKMMVEHKIGFDPTLTIQRIPDSAHQRFGLPQFIKAQDSYDRMSRFVARAFKAGVTVLAGTDDGNLLDEMEAYSSVGIPNVDVLRTATINGARWLHKESEFGTVEPGKRADLLVIDGDPLAAMKDIHKTAAVIQAGRVVFER